MKTKKHRAHTTANIVDRNLAVRPRMLALEPRLLFDGAAVATAVDVSQDSQTNASSEIANPTESNASTEFAAAIASAPAASDNPVAIDNGQIESVTSLSGLTDTDLMLSQPAGGTRNELVVVDGGLANLQTLLDDITAADPSRAVLILDPAGDEVSQLNQYLQQHSNEYDAIHVMSHGGTAWISLGNQDLPLDDLSANADLWASVKASLHSGGDLLLYGCNVGSTAESRAVINTLSYIIGGDVAVSTDETGTGGNWSLEFKTGVIESAAITPEHYQNDLPTLAVTSINVNEASPYAVVQIKGTAGTQVTLTLGGTATGGGVDWGAGDDTNLQYSTDGGTWSNYTSGTQVTLNQWGKAFVRTTIHNDPQYDNNETISITATQGATIGTGIITIKDDGTGNVYTGSVDPSLPLDASAAYAAATTPAEKQAALEAWRTLNYEKSRYIIGSFHGAFYKAEGGGYYVSGEMASPTGTNITTPLLVTPANGYTYTGTVIDLVTAADAAEYAILTTDGLWVWGKANQFVDILMSDTFRKVNLPAGLNPANAVSMSATSFGMGILMNDGSVYTLGWDTNSGHPITTLGGYNTFAKVLVNANTALTGITDYVIGTNVPGSTLSKPVSFAYDETANKFYTWGSNSFLGNGTNGSDRAYAVEMTNPLPTGVKAVQIGITDSTYFVLGTDGRIYTLGKNEWGVAGIGNTTHQTTWTVVKNSAGTGDLTNVQFISIQNGTDTWASASAILTDGTLLSWGNNSNGMLGLSGSGITTTNSSYWALPKAPTGLPSGSVFTVENAGHFTAVLMYGCSGQISVTGHNPGGAFGDGTISDRLTYGTNMFLGDIAGSCSTPDMTVVSLAGTDDDRTLAINNIAVNEASPYAVFEVTGVTGQYISLALAETTNASGNASLTADTAYAGSASSYPLQYFNGTSWVDYTAGSLVQIPAGNKMLVRTKVVNDVSYEGPETFTLTVKNLTANNTNGSSPSATGTATIYDDGTGNLYPDNITGALDTSSVKNDDRPITIANIDVNEGTGKAVFTISGEAGQKINSLSLAAGTATASATGSNADYGTGLEYWNGTTWATFTQGATVITLDSNGKALVRNVITNDTTPDNGETYTLTAGVLGGVTATGTATIHDDGTGDIYNATGGLDTTTVKDGDYPLSVNNLIVNEGSPYAVWTVKYVAGQTVNLDLAFNSTASPADLGASGNPGLEYYNGGAWVAYTPGSGAAVTIPNGGQLLVRTTVNNDQPFEVSEDLSLKVSKWMAGNTNTITDNTAGLASPVPIDNVKVVSGANALDTSANLIRNGDFSAVPAGGSPWSWGPATNGPNVIPSWTASGGGTGTYASLSGGVVYFGNQSGWTAVETGSGTPYNASTLFDSNNVTATPMTFTPGYTGFGDNDHPLALSQSISTTVGATYRLQFTQLDEGWGGDDGIAAIKITGCDRVYFKVPYRSVNVFTFEFTATSTNTNISFMNWGHVGRATELKLDNVIVNVVPKTTGGLTILDNGQGELFSSANTTGVADAPGTATQGGTLALNDDRGINPIVNDITANEGSPYAVFTVNGLPGATVDLTLASVSATVGTDTSGLQWFNGSDWVNYVSADGATVNADGTILVRTVPTNDTTLETSETFTLKAQYSTTQPAGITVNTDTNTNFDTGTCTIKDDGTGQWFTGTSGTGSNTAPAGSTLNDDRTLTVDGFTINEASPYGIFKVHGAAGQYVSLALATDGTGSGHAVLADDLTNAGTSVPLQYYNGSAWVDYTPGSLVQIPAGGTMLVRTKIVNDTSYENSESFVLNAMNVDATFKTGADAAAGTASATGIIKDDGTGSLFSSSNTTGNADTAGTNGLPSILNNDAPITVNNISVNEGSPYGVFTLGGTAGRSITLDLAGVTATAGGVDFGAVSSVTTVGQSNLEYSLDGGSTWVRYTGAFTSTLTNNATNVLVRTPIVNDSVYDNGETFTLTATPAGGNAVVGTATIHDDGTGQWFDGTSGAGNNSAPSGQHLDGDMPLTVNNLIVNEGTPYAIWTVTYGAGKQVTLSLTDGTSAEVAQMGATGIANVGSDLTLFQSGKQMQYYDPTANGGTGGWVDYVAGSNIAMPENAKLLVRVKVTNDTPLEVSEVLNLNVRVPPTAGVSDIAGTSTLNIDVVTNAAVLDSSIGANLVMNGSFSSFSGSSPVSWAGNMNAWGPNNTMYGVSTITDWTASGGGTMSYAFLMPGSPPSVKWTSGGVYFGNSTGWSISGAPATWYQMFDGNGMATGNYTFTGPTGYSENGPLKISQTIQTEAGATYRIQFTQGAERYSAYTDFSEPGVAAIEIDGQRVYFRINDSGLTVYTLQFTAPTSSTNISFMSWGHIGSTYPALSAELVLDNVIVNQMSGPSVTGTLTILDAGQTSYNGQPVNMFTENNTTGIPDSSGTTGLGANGLPSILNDDRANNPVVNDVTVNEGSPYGMFTVSGLPNAVVDLSATAGSASLSEDFSGLAWSNDGGSTWSTHLSGATLDNNGNLLVRFVPTNDTSYEGSENFTLTATYPVGNTTNAGLGIDNTIARTDSGTGTILDDGTGQWFANSNSGLGTNTAPAGSVLNDDRVISVNSIGVNEASNYAVFTVTGTAGQTVNNLALAADTATGAGADYGGAANSANNLEYSLDGGANWSTYSTGGAFNVPNKDAAGNTVSSGSPNGSFLVRTKVINDAPFDNGENFTLTATLTSGQTSTGTGTIFDDGTGTIYNANGTIDNTTAKNDDRGANPVVNSVTVNEGSPYIVFTAEGKPGAKLDLLLTAGTAAGGTTSPTDGTVDYSTSLQYFDGTTWQPYTAGSSVVLPTNTGGKLFVRTAVVNDASNEGSQTFTLKATYSATQPAGITVTSGANSTGTGTIVDNGTGTIFSSADPALGTLNGNSVWFAPTVTPPAGSVVLAANAATLPNDDRPLTITGFTVNEASPYGIFKITGAAGQYVTLSSANDTAIGGTTTPTDGSVDYNTNLEYYNGSAWVSYTPGSYVQIPTGGTTLLVRTAIVNDNSYEGQQSMTLTAANTQGSGGTGNTVTGIGYIIDNGTGSLFSGSNTTGTADSPGTNGAPATLNDDRVANPSVNSVTVNEASPYIVFTISGMPQAGVTIALNNNGTGMGHAVLGTDTAATSALQMYVGGSWVAYNSSTAVLDSNGQLLVRLAITNDSPAVYEGPETFGITATYNGLGTPASAVTVGGSASGVGTIIDNGTGSLFSSTNSTGTADAPGANGAPATLDNDKPNLTVNDVSVNEADGTMTFTVTLNGSSLFASTVDYSTSDGTAQAYHGSMISGGADFTDVSGTLSFAPGETTKTVTVPIINNDIYEGTETLNLNISNATGGATITDNLGVGSINDAADLPTATITNVSVVEANDQYAVVTVTLDKVPGIPVTFTPTLSNAGTGAAFAIVGTDTQNTPSGAAIEYSLNGGSTWLSAAAGVTIPSGSTSVQLRSAIHMNDGVAEQTETYNINTGSLTAGTATITGVTGTVSIVDNPTMSISNVTVNEASPYAVVQISLTTPASSPINFTPSLTNGSGTAAVDTGTMIQYLNASNQWVDAASWNGTAWVAVNGGVTIPTGASGVLLRTSVVNDPLNEVSETVNISTGTATNVLNPSGVTGVITILDQGTNTTPANNSIFTAGNTSAMPDSLTPTNAAVVDPLNPGTGKVLLNDDRPLSVNSVTVNEASPYIVFTVTGAVDQYVKLSTVDGTAVGGTTSPMNGSVDYSQNLQYFDGTTWQNYTPGSFVMIPGYGTTLLVRTAVVNDVPYEGAQTFNLVATNTGGTSTPISQGIGTIVDDGTGALFSGSNNSATPNTVNQAAQYTDLASVLNDDRPVTVSSVIVTEVVDTYAVFDIVGHAGQSVVLSTRDVTANSGADFSTQIEVNNGNGWVNYVPGSPVALDTQGKLQARVVVNPDGSFESNESFNLNATVVGGQTTANGTGTILDNFLIPPSVKPASGTITEGNRPWERRWEQKPIELGQYEFHNIVLDFNGQHGGINQFRHPESDTTRIRGALEYSNHTPYTAYDRVGDEVGNANRSLAYSRASLNDPDMGLRNVLPVPDVAANSGKALSYRLPASTFTGGKGDVKLTAVQKDGTPLPAWLKFNPKTGHFEGDVPADLAKPIDVRVIATDDVGGQAEAKVRIKPDAKSVGLKGKPGLSAQLKAANNPAGLAASLGDLLRLRA